MEYEFEDGISLVQVKNSYYRVHHVKDFEKSKSSRVEMDDDFDEHEGDERPEIQHKDGVFILEMRSIDPGLYGSIIGKGGKTLRGIQERTGAMINVPTKTGGPDDYVTVRSASKKNVLRAAAQIDVIVVQSREKAPFSHFLSLPLTGLSDGLGKLQQMIADDSVIPRADKRGFEAKIATAPPHFHLTLFMLKLLTDSEVQKCSSLLKELSQVVYDVVGTRSLVVRLRGLEIMNDDPSDTHVLFAKVEDTEDGRLKKLCSLLSAKLLSEGLITEDDADVKLHATILNTRYRNLGADDRSAPRISFDARAMLDKFGAYDFGTVRIPSLELSQRGKYGPEGYYHCVQKVHLP